MPTGADRRDEAGTRDPAVRPDVDETICAGSPARSTGQAAVGTGAGALSRAGFEIGRPRSLLLTSASPSVPAHGVSCSPWLRHRARKGGLPPPFT